MEMENEMVASGTYWSGSNHGNKMTVTDIGGHMPELIFR